MNHRATILLALLLIATQLPAEDKPSPAKGETKPARQLFDGKTLDGWEHIGPGTMTVEDGLMKTSGGMGLLWWTKEKFGDCVIRVVWKAKSETSNAGVFVRIEDKPGDPWYAVNHGYEVQILEKTDDFHRTGAVYSLSKATAKAEKPVGEFNTMEITLKGPLILVEVNGVKVNEFDPTKPVPKREKNFEPERGPRPEKGYIGIQNHDDYSKESTVWFKEISVRPL